MREHEVPWSHFQESQARSDLRGVEGDSEIDFRDPGGLEERVVSRIAAQQLIEEFKRLFPKEQYPTQWQVFQAALAVVRQGEDALDIRSFYNAIFQWLESHHPESNFTREGVRIYWWLVCKTLRQIAAKEELEW